MTMIEIYSAAGGRDKPETVAVWEDGEWTQGQDKMEGVFPGGAPDSPEEVLDGATGPGLYASEDPASYENTEKLIDAVAPVVADKSWIPYEGPQGGQGWQNVETDEVVYQDDPPGKTLSPEDILDAAEEAGMNMSEVREAVEEITDGDVEAGGDDRGAESVRRAIAAFEESDTDSLDGSTKETLGNRIEHDAGNAVRPGIMEKAVERTAKFEQKGMSSGSPERAFYRGIAKSSTIRDHHGGTMGLGASGSSNSTITHEFGHAIASSFGFDYVSNGGVAHNYSEWDREWDFGGEHPNKKDFMFHDFGPLEDRRDHDWEEYVERAESVIESYEDVSLGDRVAIRGTITNEIRDLSVGDMAVGELPVTGRVSGEVTSVNGSVVTIETDDGNTHDIHAGNFTKGTVRAGGILTEGDIVPMTSPMDYMDAQNGMTIRASEAEATGNNEKHPMGTVIEDPMPLTISDTATWEDGPVVARDDDGDEYYVFEQHITQAEGQTEYAIRDPNSGSQAPLDESAMDEGLVMASAENRDWVSVSTYGEEPTTGSTVRFRFGTDDDFSIGTVVDEGRGQMLVQTPDGDERWLNKGETFQQTVQIADDQSEFRRGDPASSPPGFVQSVYEHGDYTERDVDWDTYVQYQDADEQKAEIDTGDLVLVNLAGERVPAKVEDIYGDDTLQVSYPREVRETLRNKDDLPYGALPPDMSGGSIDPWDNEDTRLVGVAPREQFITDSFDGISLQDFDGFVEDVEPGTVIEYRKTSGFGSARTREGRVVGFGEFTGGTPYVQVERPDGSSRKMSVNSLSVESYDPDTETATSVVRGSISVDDLSGDLSGLAGHELSVTIDGTEVSIELNKPWIEDYHGTRSWYFNGWSDEAGGMRLFFDHESGEFLGTGMEYEDSEVEIGDITTAESLAGGRPATVDDVSGLEPEDRIEINVDGVPRVAEVNEVHGDYTIETSDGVIDTLDPDVEVVRVASPEDFDIEPEDDRTDRQVVEDLIEQTNRSWYKMASKREAGGRPTNIGGAYSETNAHETLAMTHQTLQSGSAYSITNVHDRHPDLLMAYIDVFEPDDEAKTVLNDLYEESPYSSPFNSTPFPEVQEVVISASEVESMIETGDQFAVPEGYDGGWGRVLNVVEGDVLYEDTETGEEHWMDIETAAETLPGIDIPQNAVIGNEQ